MTPSPRLRIAALSGLALWIAAHGGSVLAAGRPGLEGIIGFVGWQTGAGMIALALLMIRAHLPRATPLHRLCLVPSVLAGVLLVALVALLLYGFGVNLVRGGA